MTRPTPAPEPSPREADRRRRPGLSRFALATRVAWVAAASAVLAAFAVNQSASPPSPAASSPPPVRPRHPVAIRQPIEPPRVDTGKFDPQSRAITVSCGSCHATSTPRTDTRTATDLDEFHQGLEYQHGNLTCLSCHNAGNYDQLRLADGRGVPFPEAMSLCAQCHGPQFRDYSHGSHGGMTGFWDLTRGPRQRNHCVDCHDPHAPQFPVVVPAFPLPADRGLKSQPSSPRPHG